MGFAQGFARGFLRQGEMNEARREQERQREFQSEQKESDRQHDFALIKAQTEAKNKTLIAQLRAKRKAAESAASSSVNQYNALASKLSGTEGADEYLKTVAKDPRVASKILDTVTDIQERTKREITPAEIIQYITPIVSGEEPEVLTFEDELEQLMYEDALSEVERPESALNVSGSLYTQYAAADVKLAEETFTNAMLDIARRDVESLQNMGDSKAADVSVLINEAEGGNQFALSRLRDRYADAVAPDFLSALEDKPHLRPILQSPVYGAFLSNFQPESETEMALEQDALGTLKQAYEQGLLSEENVRELRKIYPGEFE